MGGGGAGHLANVATVLAALAKKLDAARLVEAARAEYEANLAAKIEDPAFTQDILPLLARSPAYDAGRLSFDVAEQFDAKQAWAQVHGAFVSLLPGVPWKGAL